MKLNFISLKSVKLNFISFKSVKLILTGGVRVDTWRIFHHCKTTIHLWSIHSQDKEVETQSIIFSQIKISNSANKSNIHTIQGIFTFSSFIWQISSFESIVLAIFVMLLILQVGHIKKVKIVKNLSLFLNRNTWTKDTQHKSTVKLSC